jgi:hypothetical protein
MSNFEQSVKELPSYDVLAERYDFLKQFEGDEVFFDESNPDYKWVRWENGSGDEGTLVLFADKEHALIYGYDHESDLNFYNNPEEQKVFTDIDEPYQNLVADKSPLAWEWDDSGFIFATSGFWLVDGSWQYSADYAESIDWENDKDDIYYVLKVFLVSETNTKKRLSHD